MPTKPPGVSAPVFANPYFKTLLWINSALCVLSLAVMVGAAWNLDPATGDIPRGRERIYATCEKTFLLTAGAFIGLLCGRTALPDKKG